MELFYFGCVFYIMIVISLIQRYKLKSKAKELNSILIENSELRMNVEEANNELNKYYEEINFLLDKNSELNSNVEEANNELNEYIEECTMFVEVLPIKKVERFFFQSTTSGRFLICFGYFEDTIELMFVDTEVEAKVLISKLNKIVDYFQNDEPLSSN